MFSEKLNKAILAKKTPLCVGLDPRLDWLPSSIKTKALSKYGQTFKAAARAIGEFNRQIIDIVGSHVPAVKLQSAFYEQYGPDGLQTFKESINYAKRQGLLVIADIKRADIATTTQAYADGFLGKVDVFGEKRFCYDVDAVTVNPFLGEDSLLPFIEVCRRHGKGIFILVKTSNPGSRDIQDQIADGQTISEKIALIVNKHGQKSKIDHYGYSSVGAVVGLQFPEAARKLRQIMPRSIFLVPGFGAQGGDVAGLKHFFNPDSLGAIVSSSRGIVFSSRGRPDWDRRHLTHIENAVLAAKKNISEVLST